VHDYLGDYSSKLNMNKMKDTPKILIGVLVVVVALVGGVLVSQKFMTIDSPDYLALAETSIANKSYGEAYSYLVTGKEIDPSNLTYYIMISDLFEEKGRIDESITWMEEALVNCDDKSTVYKKLYPLYLQIGDTAKAKEIINTLLSEITDNSSLDWLTLNYSLYQINLAEKQLDAAKANLQSITTIKTNTDIYYQAIIELLMFNLSDATSRNILLATANEEMSTVKESASKIAQYITKAEESKARLDTSQENAWYGVALLDFNRCQLALPYFQAAIDSSAANGVYVGAHMYYGQCLYETAMYTEAIAELQLTIDKDPTKLEAWKYQALACEQISNAECADNSFTKLITVGNSNIDYHRLYSNYLLKQSRTLEAISQLEEIVSFTSDSLSKDATIKEILKLLLVIYENDPSLEANVSIYDKATNYLELLSVKDSEYYDLKGWFNYLNSKAGEEDILTALEMDKYNASANYHKAFIDYERSEMNSAKGYAVKAVDYSFDKTISDKATELLKMISAIS
jgi:tetratricopeptide (TPR) repeat protein